MSQKTWISDRAGSTVGFSIDHRTGVLAARFERFEVCADAPLGDGAHLGGFVESGSLVVGDPGLAAFALSPALLDAVRHPRMAFASTAVRRADALVELAGTLSVKGRALAVVAMGTVAGDEGSDRLRLELETRIDRRQFGLDWDERTADGGWSFGHEVRVFAHLQFVRTHSTDRRI
jgi:polyisoprenoid-binding protein YceI